MFEHACACAPISPKLLTAALSRLPEGQKELNLHQSDPYCIQPQGSQDILLLIRGVLISSYFSSVIFIYSQWNPLGMTMWTLWKTGKLFPLHLTMKTQQFMFPVINLTALKTLEPPTRAARISTYFLKWLRPHYICQMML